MPISVTRDDVETALVRPLTSTEQTYVDALCDQAIVKLKGAIRGIEARVDAFATDPTAPTSVDPDLVAAVLAGAIKRVLVNPQGLWSTTQAAGPMSESMTFSGSRAGDAGGNSPGALAITKADVDEIEGRTASAFVLPGTIRTRPRFRDAR